MTRQDGVKARAGRGSGSGRGWRRGGRASRPTRHQLCRRPPTPLPLTLTDTAPGPEAPAGSPACLRTGSVSALGARSSHLPTKAPASLPRASVPLTLLVLSHNAGEAFHSLIHSKLNSLTQQMLVEYLLGARRCRRERGKSSAPRPLGGAQVDGGAHATAG